MFIIKQKQLDALAKVRLDAFKKRLEKHLGKYFDEVINKLTKEQLDYFVDEIIKRAEQYELETEYQITAYSNIMLTLGVDFEKNEEYKWAEGILEGDLPAEDKINKIIEIMESKVQ